ncbi:restriction endonuclease [Microbacterium lacticum]|uniref:restriction endonuclease subunit S n=1 Tax=Microbacterium lacticum TaxID=33885 RepID=UPI0018B06A47|nr:restriction endonuclease subunit S [Microbacterium lacticum]MBF9334806.1 restriction endonuclease [Microbacterium lacticum]
MTTTVPDGWTEANFADIADYSIGRTPARARSEYWANDGENVPWVAISDMKPHGIVASTKETISGLAFRESFGARVVPAGTLLMSFKLTIGRVATLGIDACHNEAIMSIYPHEGVNQRYLGYYLSQVDYSEHHDRQIKGNTLNKAKIDRIPVLLPPESEQEAIADVLDLIVRAQDLGSRLTSFAEGLRRTAMDRLMTGALSVSELDLDALPRIAEVSQVAS